MGLVPLSEWGRVDLDDSGLGEGVGTDELVVGGMEGDNDHTDLAGDALRSPREVAGLEAQRAELAVATTGADKMDSLRADTGVGFLSSGFESALLPCKFLVFRLEHMPVKAHRLSTTHGKMISLRQRRTACGGNHEKYP